VKLAVFIGDLSFLAVSSLISGRKAGFRARKGHAATGPARGVCGFGFFCGVSGLVSLIWPPQPL